MTALNPKLISLFLLIFFLFANSAWAALGQMSAKPATVSPSPGAKMLALVPAARLAPYTVEETRLENGTSVREYATPAGLVFAVAWQGPVLPDLSVLLGNYFNAFKLETDQARLLGRRGAPVDMSRDTLVVRSNGRMRNFFGHAYATDLVPSGVSVKDILQ